LLEQEKQEIIEYFDCVFGDHEEGIDRAPFVAVAGLRDQTVVDDLHDPARAQDEPEVYQYQVLGVPAIEEPDRSRVKQHLRVDAEQQHPFVHEDEQQHHQRGLEQHQDRGLNHSLRKLHLGEHPAAHGLLADLGNEDVEYQRGETYINQHLVQFEPLDLVPGEHHLQLAPQGQLLLVQGTQTKLLGSAGAADQIGLEFCVVLVFVL